MSEGGPSRRVEASGPRLEVEQPPPVLGDPVAPDTAPETELEREGDVAIGADEHLGLLNVLLIGSGGREHAIANAIARSPRLRDLYVSPGNPGTRAYNIDLDVDDPNAVIAFCAEERVDLVVVGPEGPLVEGLADRLTQRGINCFGPSAAAARLEGSKSFARRFAERHGIPGPVNQTFTDADEAVAWLRAQPFDVVVKADGLAAGKGVIVPSSKEQAEVAIRAMLAGEMGESGRTLLLEERLDGEEVSLFGISSATQLDALGGLTAQDHKRVGDGDTGPNTGGMGAFAPVPTIDPLLVETLVNTFLVPVQSGMADEGTPFTGVIYAGIMLTMRGPRLIEYNCRFGDPEAQVLLPLLEGDLLNVMYAAATNQPWPPLVARRSTASVVVVCAEGYPSAPLRGVSIPPVVVPDGATLLHAGTAEVDGSLVSAGGRVLNAVGVGADIDEALDRSYAIVDQLVGQGLFARSDIGWRYTQRLSRSGPESDQGDHSDLQTSVSTIGGDVEGAVPGDAYAAAGVSLDSAAEVTRRIGDAVRSTHDDRVVAGLGSFGGVLSAAALKEMDDPLLVASTDGVGTKTMLAQLAPPSFDRAPLWRGFGADIVNHGINDVLVQGARPVFFLDTVASARLEPSVVEHIVDGMADACRKAGCVLLGGETAEMPGLLAPGGVDISGTMVGVVERAALLPRPGIRPGYKLIGLKSNGLHTNGYSLARKVVKGKDVSALLPGGAGESILEALTTVHRSYLPLLDQALGDGGVAALAHITGGGLIDNLPRVLPEDMGAYVDRTAWPLPPLFAYLIKQAKLDVESAHQILNCGIGMVVIAAPDAVEDVRSLIPADTFVIGEVTATPGIVLS